jgi:histidinol phosphatase-like PHP family hydrolase
MINTNHNFVFQASSLINKLPKVDFHIHTNWTDGKNSISEIYERAQILKLESIVFTEHSSRTSDSWFDTFADNVTNLATSNTKVHLGSEVRIFNLDGEIEILDSVSSICEIILASVHRFPDASGKVVEFSDIPVSSVLNLEFRLMKSAIINSQAHIIAHPFGMSLERFKLHPTIDMWIELIELSKKHGVALEINSKYHKNFEFILDLYIKENALISIGSDVHELDTIGHCIDKIERFLSAK